MRRGRERSTAQGVVFGLALMALGIVVLLGQLGVISRPWMSMWWEWWPAILVLVGAVRMIRPADPKDFGGGLTTMLFGFWFFANIYEWYGLRWHNSWPIALVAVGAGMMARAIATAVMRGAEEEKKEESHG